MNVVKSLWYWLIKLFYVLISQAFLTALCLMAYTGALTVFYYKVKTEVMSKVVLKYGCQIVDESLIDRWRFSILAFGVIYCTIFRWVGVENWMAKQFLVTSEIVCVVTWAIILMNSFFIKLIAEPYLVMLALDLGTGVATLGTLFFTIKYGFHKED